MPIYYQEGEPFQPEDETTVRNAFAGTTLEAIYDGDDAKKEVWMWSNWHTSPADSRSHITVKLFEDNNGHLMTSFYHVYRNETYRYWGEESPSSYAQRLENWNTTDWGWRCCHTHEPGSNQAIPCVVRC